jgi:SAM-dependent methyltransferase
MNGAHGMEQTADFTRIADAYDLSRSLPADIMTEFYRRLIAAGVLRVTDRVLDAGCGTGQLSLPLFVLGVDVTGVDVSLAMVERARTKFADAHRSRFIVGDIRDLGLADNAFDLTIASKLFQHVANWQRGMDEICRVTRAGGYFINISERGAFWNQVRARFAAECGKLGHVNRYLGLHPQQSLSEYAKGRGAHAVAIDIAGLTWQKRVAFGEVYRQLQQRLFAEFWPIPEADYEQALANVRRWIDAHKTGAGTVMVMDAKLTIEAFRIA